MRKPRAEIRKNQHWQDEGQPQHKWTHPVKIRRPGLSQRSKAEPKAIRRGQGQEEGRRNACSREGTGVGAQVPLRQDQPVTVPWGASLGVHPTPAPWFLCPSPRTSPPSWPQPHPFWFHTHRVKHPSLTRGVTTAAPSKVKCISNIQIGGGLFTLPQQEFGTHTPALKCLWPQF